MIIYRLVLEYFSIDVEIKDQNEIRITHNELDSNSSVDSVFMLKKYDIEISASELVCYKFHQSSWRLFEKSGHASCLIMEFGSKLLVPIRKIEIRMRELPEDWDIYFPFDHKYLTLTLESNYLASNQNGSYAYFLSNKGVKKLLADVTIKLPLYDQLMAFLTSGELNVYTDDINLIEGQHWPPLISDRQKAIKKSIFSKNVWNPKSRLLLQEIMLSISSIAVTLAVNLVLDSGSLLGHIRHGQIMLWDDDVDLAISKGDLNKFLVHVELAGLCIGKYQWDSNCYYYKIWSPDGEVIREFEHKFPFIDIWIFEIRGDKIEFHDSRVFEYSLFFPLRTILFEGFIFKVPSNSVGVLSEQYADWSTCIRVYPWCHRLERNHNIPLKLNISVDKDGRLFG